MQREQLGQMVVAGAGVSQHVWRHTPTGQTQRGRGGLEQDPESWTGVVEEGHVLGRNAGVGPARHLRYAEAQHRPQ